MKEEAPLHLRTSSTRESLSDEIMIKRTRRRNRESQKEEPSSSSSSSLPFFKCQSYRTKHQTPNKMRGESGLFVVVTIALVSLVSALSLHPPKCHWDLHSHPHGESSEGQRLICYAEAGSSSLIMEEEVDGLGPEQAKSLWVQCGESDSDLQTGDSSYFHPSDKVKVSSSSGSGFVLTQGVFMAVPSLRDLRLENCAIAGITPGALGYLPFLHNLTIRAHTSLKFPSSQLEVKAGVLRGLPELRKLDFSTTSLSSLPNDFLCFLPSLNHLNLSACGLRDLRSVGVAPTDPTNPHNCGQQIKSLDLSHNQLSLLPPATFSSVQGALEELRIDHNSITSASERALLGLHSLKIFSAAYNKLSSLQPEFFKDSRSLSEVYLQNNSLVVLAPGLFSGLESLVVLDLSSNELTSEWVLGETFRGLIRLVFLNLSHNRLGRLDSLLFKSLSSLQVLNLEHNQVSSISSDAFSAMSNLHSLLLSHNKLKILEPFICKGLGVLSFLALDNNGIEVVGMETFSNCSNVMDLNLSGNKLTSVPEAVGALSLLRTLDVGENKIEDLSNSSAYASLPNLYGLRLTDNKIRHVPKGALAKLGSLKIVNFAKNNISSIEAGAFDNNPNLQAIRLDSNKLWNVSGLFRHIPNLLWLNISANSLTELRYEDFPPRLQWLDLRANSISLLGSCLEVDTPLKIKNLDLSHNQVSEISASNLPDSIQNLILSHNQIKTLAPYTFFRKANLSRVDLSSNQLSNFDQNSLRISPSGESVELLLGNNPLKCDCSMEWLLQSVLNGESASGSYPAIVDVEKVTCSVSHKKVEKVRILDISSESFLCPYTSHCFPLCQCCDYGACDCALSCPANCSCYHDSSWRVNVVDCSSLGVSSIPEKVPMDVTELRLDGNVLPVLDSHAFIGRKSLQSLYLNSSHIEVIGNRTLHRLKLLRVLHLEGNFIERLEGREFEDLDALQELYLHDNSLSFVDTKTFSALISLKILTLHGNALVKVALWDMVLVKRLDEVTLSGNPWSCECSFSNKLREWVGNNRDVVTDASDVHCVQEGALIRLLDNGNNNLCSSSQPPKRMIPPSWSKSNGGESGNSDLMVKVSESESVSDDWWSAHSTPLLITLSVVLALLLLIVGAGVVIRWRKTLQVWFYAQTGVRLTFEPESSEEKEKLFDAFVSYSSKDEAWVRQVFAGELEGRSEPPFRLCLRYRDLPSGGNYVGDTIVQAAEASRRTILILSHHFLKGEWSRSDVKSAHHSVLKERGRRVILILLGDLPTKDLDPDLRLLIKNHTLLTPEDSKFWDKLRYALPDVKGRDTMISRGTHGRSSSSHNNHHSHGTLPPPPQYQHPYPLPPTPTTTATETQVSSPSQTYQVYSDKSISALNYRNNEDNFNSFNRPMSNPNNNASINLPPNIVPVHPHHHLPVIPMTRRQGVYSQNNQNSNNNNGRIHIV